MSIRLYSFPEHDLTVFVARGRTTNEDVVAAFKAMDATYATKLLEYLDATMDMSEIDLANLPAIRRIKREKRLELFADNPKPMAIVCESKDAKRFFAEFWQRYVAAESNERYFYSLDEAYDWLGLSAAARASAVGAIAGVDADAGARPEATTSAAHTARRPNAPR
jgi:hypothetical protein